MMKNFFLLTIFALYVSADYSMATAASPGDRLVSLLDHESKHAQCMDIIPQKIWQTYKTKQLPKPAAKAARTWHIQNPDCQYTLCDDDEIGAYIYDKCDKNTCAFFDALPLGVMKADLWRYVIIANEGGIYSDVDTACRLPLKWWAPGVPGENKDILLIALEPGGATFCQWTFAATPHHPAMEYICQRVVRNWMEQGIDLSDVWFVHKTTGPYIWTHAILEYLEVPYCPAKEVYQRYLNDPAFKAYVEAKGIWIFHEDFYHGRCVSHLYGGGEGSSFCGDGYVPWKDERDKLLQEKQPVHLEKSESDPPL